MIGEMEYRYTMNEASEADIHEHLLLCSTQFVPPLESTVNLGEYTHKIHLHAVRVEAWHNSRLVGMVAAYLNDPRRTWGFITNVSVVQNHTGKGLATELVTRCMEEARALGFLTIGLEVSESNRAAVKLYHKLGFKNDPSRGVKTLVKELNPSRS